ncbi:MAG: hypothetical protein H9855_00125 [Candidatus Acinetobacter avistercoris]|uniref:HD domain-containing protein n=1 Tax=Acinetobacter sp. KS-LM10 TaxID=3120518 RepID=UPI001F8FA328|nr:hypothetical protein [Candidatus Acinetobacter avistercoris]
MLLSEQYQQDFCQYWERSALQSLWSKAHHDAIYTLLNDAYSESQRYYHQQQHIVECLQLYHQIKHLLNDSLAVEIAIWFHDVVYDPKAKDNELLSAELMKQYCQDFLSEAQLEKVYHWIIATQKHLPSDDTDLNTLLDIDLAILGSQSDRFAEYEKQIKLEYAWVNAATYLNKRSEVLSDFYQMQPIYQTFYIQEKFEQRAKANLQSFVELNEIWAIQTLYKFNALRLKNDQKFRKQKRYFWDTFKYLFGELLIFFLISVLIGTVVGLSILVGLGAFFLLLPFGALIYYYFLKKKPKKIKIRNDKNWLLQAPQIQHYLFQLENDCEQLRAPLLIYCMYMTEYLSLDMLEDVSIRLSEYIFPQAFDLESVSSDTRELIRAAKSEYSFSLNKVAEVCYLLIMTQRLNKMMVEEMIQKLFQTFALYEQDFIKREDHHLRKLLAQKNMIN